MLKSAITPQQFFPKKSGVQDCRFAALAALSQTGCSSWAAASAEAQRVGEGAINAWPRARTSFHPVAGGGVLFDAAKGRLYAFNPAAGMTWLCIKDGLSGHECTVALSKAFEIDRPMAAEWVRVSMDAFQHLGLLQTLESTERLPLLNSGRTSPNRSLPGGASRVPNTGCLETNLAPFSASWSARRAGKPPRDHADRSCWSETTRMCWG